MSHHHDETPLSSIYSKSFLAFDESHAQWSSRLGVEEWVYLSLLMVNSDHLLVSVKNQHSITARDPVVLTPSPTTTTNNNYQQLSTTINNYQQLSTTNQPLQHLTPSPGLHFSSGPWARLLSAAASPKRQPPSSMLRCSLHTKKPEWLGSTWPWAAANQPLLL